MFTLKMPDYYNHGTWPSPRAKIVAKKLDLDYTPGYYGMKTKIKRITHAQALECLRRKAKKATVEEFLAMPEKEAWIALGCLYQSPWSREQIPYNPLYGPKYY
jgi:hypothetical protein